MHDRWELQDISSKKLEEFERGVLRILALSDAPPESWSREWALAGGTLAMTDSEEDDADKDLLLDWRGQGTGTGGKGLVQQTLGFKQEQIYESPFYVGEACGSGIVCLDSDSEPELYPSCDVERRASRKSITQENLVVSRSWEKAPWAEEKRIINTGAGPSKPCEVSPVLEKAGGHEISTARPLERRDDASEREAATSVLALSNQTVTESVLLSKKSPPALAKCPSSTLASTWMPAKDSVSTLVRESQEKIDVRSSIIIEDLSTSSDDEDDEFRNPRGNSLCRKDNRTLLSNGLQISEFDSGKKRSWGRVCSQSQDCLRPEESKRVAGISRDETSADEAPNAGKSTGGAFYISAKALTLNASDELTGSQSRVLVHDLDASDSENAVKQIPPKKTFTRSAKDPILKERPANLDVVNLDSQTSILSGGWDEGTEFMHIDNAPSAFEAVRSVVDQEKSDKRKKRVQDPELRREEKARKEEEKAKKDEEKKLRKEENRKKREEQRQQKEAAKAEAAERKRIEQECGKWKKGKFALENTSVYIDKRIIESKTLGPPLLQQLASKEYQYHVVTNPVEKTILWTMKRPPDDSKAILEMRESQEEPFSQLPLEDVEVKYSVVFLDAADFTDMVAGNAVNSHISKIKEQHPGYTVCYLVNNLTRYIYKKEQLQYRNGDKSWKRPNVEQVLAEFITHHVGVRFRLCVDENEMAEHIVGLTRSLAESPFKPKLTSLTINANGELIGKNDPNRDVIRRDPWKKALAAIPNMTGAAVIAITKVYPTMRSLLNAYLDPSKTVLEKEFLLQNIVKDAALGSARADGRRVGPACSKRVYRLLMAQNGNLRTEDAEEGEDYFRQ
ncbi:hypothetical protein R1flu_016073 [Riccia fluitans]|uniref:ERCC4 domain-containing protein n=1 Tax=Riccia fluitans TaxID=41844 RepID=A0ABD1YPM3_9MARC